MGNYIKFIVSIFIIFLSILISATLTFAAWFGPNDFDDCVLRSMKGVTSEMAAKMIYKSCREKFPLKVEKSFDLTFDKLVMISGRVGCRYNSLSGKIYNKNTDTVVTKITISIKNGTNVDYYNYDCDIDPLSTQSIYLGVDSCPKELIWTIISAKGRKAK